MGYRQSYRDEDMEHFCKAVSKTLRNFLLYLIYNTKLLAVHCRQPLTTTAVKVYTNSEEEREYI